MLCLGALPAQTAPLISTVGQEIALGDNLNGEVCRLRRTTSPKSAKDATRQDFGIFCEGWTQSSGFIVSFTASPKFNPIDHLTKSDYAGQMTNRLAECAPAAASKVAERLAGAVRFCRRRDGGWPVVVTSAGPADSPPVPGGAWVSDMQPASLSGIRPVPNAWLRARGAVPGRSARGSAG